MSIPLVDLKAQYASIEAELRAAMDRVIQNTAFILGSEVEQFEAAFAEFVRADHVVGASSGTSALHLALLACGVGPGDEVIVPANTFIATAEAVLHAGAQPVFVDVDSETLTLTAEQVELALTPKTRAVIPVHLFGHPADMDPILELAEAQGLAVIEDAAQAHGAEYKGRRIGTLGRAACFSFYPGKNLGAYGDGGAVATNDPELAERVRLLRNHGRAEKYKHLMPGYNYRLDALQAAILGAKLPHLDAWNEARRQHAKAYDERLAALGVETPTAKDWATPVYHIYAIQLDRRDELAAHLKARGIASGVHYPIPLHRQPAFAGGETEALPVCERAAARMLSLPMYPELTTEQIDEVCSAIADFLS